MKYQEIPENGGEYYRIVGYLKIIEDNKIFKTPKNDRDV